jgi:hypothetical protein
MTAVTLDAETIAVVLASAETVASATFRLKTSRRRLRSLCVADDVLRPLFYALADRGRTKTRLGMERLRWTEADR